MRRPGPAPGRSLLIIWRQLCRSADSRTLRAAQLLAAKNTGPIQSLDDLAAGTFESDEELAEFLAFTYAERHRGLARPRRAAGGPRH